MRLNATSVRLRENRCSDEAERDKAVEARLALRYIEDNLCFTGHEVWAWYVLPTQPWAFRSDSQREQLMYGLGDGLAWLAGHRLHLRVTTRPYPAAEWARRLHHLTPDPLESPGVEPWSEHMVTMQQHLRHQTMAEKEVFLGVRLANRRKSTGSSAAVWRHPGNIEHARLLAQVEQLDRDDASPGPGGPARHRAGDGVAAAPLDRPRPARARTALRSGRTDDWDADDLHSFTDEVEYDAPPARPHGAADGRARTRSSRAARRRDVGGPPRGDRGARPGHEPWLSHTDRLPFPVEWSASSTSSPGVEARKAIQRKLLVVRDMQRHYAEHDLDEPLALGPAGATRRARSRTR